LAASAGAGSSGATIPCPLVCLSAGVPPNRACARGFIRLEELVTRDGPSHRDTAVVAAGGARRATAAVGFRNRLLSQAIAELVIDVDAVSPNIFRHSAEIKCLVDDVDEFLAGCHGRSCCD
jgi:hypothetical protein